MLKRLLHTQQSVICRFASSHGYTHKEIKKLNFDKTFRIYTVKENARQLGFDTPEEMYPAYPLKEPPKLWLIKQRKTLLQRPWWEKDIMKYMGLNWVGDISVQMNTEQINDKLWVVKHLITIMPLLFPNGFPTEEDVGHTHINHKTGELTIKRKQTHGTTAEEHVPLPALQDYKIVDGYRMCNNCRQRDCVRMNICQKIVRQGKKNPIEKIGPKMFNYIHNPLKHEGNG